MNRKPNGGNLLDRLRYRLLIGMACAALIVGIPIAGDYVNNHYTEWRYAVIAALDCAPATDLRVETPDGRTVLLYECNTANDVYPDE